MGRWEEDDGEVCRWDEIDGRRFDMALRLMDTAGAASVVGLIYMFYTPHAYLGS